jgi:hypothetical protein
LAEIRNLVYAHALNEPKQALLVHRPRIASLRPRTRLDRHRTLNSDLKEQELDQEFSTNESLSSGSSNDDNNADQSLVKRDTNRPFWGLTQVCRQVRSEFRPLYLQQQEIGMDITKIVQYLETFYPDGPAQLAQLHNGGKRGKDVPFSGNMTIAIGDRPLRVETSAGGIEVLPLLDLWANSFRVEAGFGRYLQANYIPQFDGEAKDL